MWVMQRLLWDWVSPSNANRFILADIRSLWSGDECTQTPPQAPLGEVSPSNAGTL